MPTVYRFPKKSLQHNRVSDRDLELWTKHCEEKGIDPKTTVPATKHPRDRKKP